MDTLRVNKNVLLNITQENKCTNYDYMQLSGKLFDLHLGLEIWLHIKIAGNYFHLTGIKHCLRIKYRLCHKKKNIIMLIMCE